MALQGALRRGDVAGVTRAWHTLAGAPLYSPQGHVIYDLRFGAVPGPRVVRDPGTRLADVAAAVDGHVAGLAALVARAMGGGEGDSESERERERERERECLFDWLNTHVRRRKHEECPV